LRASQNGRLLAAAQRIHCLRFELMKRIIRVSVWGAVSLTALYVLLALSGGVSFYRSVPLKQRSAYQCDCCHVCFQ
jgi:hypothetical protein